MEERIEDRADEECAQDGAQAQNDQNATRSSRENTAGGQCRGNNVVAYPQDVVLAATSLALALSKGRSQYEIETLINLFSLTTNNLQSILAQILINKKVQDYLETPL